MLAVEKTCKEWCHYVEGSTHQVVIMEIANLQRFLAYKALNRQKA